MIKTTFEYNVNSVETIFVKASCEDIGKVAMGLKIDLPKDFHPPREVADEIEEMAIEKLKEEKHHTN